VLDYSVLTFQRAKHVARIVIVARSEDRDRIVHLLGAKSNVLLSVAPAGETRHQSEMAGIVSLESEIESGEIDLVAIHDGARPFMTLDLLNTCVATANQVGGAIPGLRPEAPLYERGEGGSRPLAADQLIRVQTPQVFRARPLLEAYRASLEAKFEGVDTAETIERFTNLEVAIVPGDERNFKVTFVEDLNRAEELASTWSDGLWRT